jgi:hypothetical protein
MKDKGNLPPPLNFDPSKLLLTVKLTRLFGICFFAFGLTFYSFMNFFKNGTQFTLKRSMPKEAWEAWCTNF